MTVMVERRRELRTQTDLAVRISGLTRVEAIDGGGIGLLVFLQGWARAAGIGLKLVSPSQHVRELLELTNLGSVFEICLSEDAALRHPTVVRASEETAASDYPLVSKRWRPLAKNSLVSKRWRPPAKKRKDGAPISNSEVNSAAEGWATRLVRLLDDGMTSRT